MTITVNLPDDVAQALHDLANREGLTCDGILAHAIRDYIFLHRFQTLRERLSAHASELGIVTDQDVFDRVS